MKLKFAAAIAALTLAWGCATAPERTYPPGPALYVVRDADSTMYLFGTLHIRRGDAPWGGPNAQAGLVASDEVWTEMEISPETEAQAQVLALQRGINYERPLSSLLTAEQNTRLAAFAQQYGLPPQMLDIMEPWFAAITLSVLPMVQAGYDPNQGADRLIDDFADQNGKTARHFETAEDQINFLSGFPLEVQVQWLVETMDQADEGAALFEGMAQAWETGDVRTLERLVVTDMRGESPDVYDVLIVRRNNAWMEDIVRELQGAGTDFVAVGAGHVIGPEGLVAQLRARGYTVERIDP